ncbi:MAG: peptidase C11 [Bacteroides sp.]|nr:peptidase C11 [Bacteroides sp.]
MAKSLFRLLPIFFFSLFVTSCSEDEVPQPEVSECAVLVYMAADNNLKNFVQDDYEEMKTGLAQLSNSSLRLFVYVDTGTSPRLVDLKYSNGKVIENVLKTYDVRNSVGVDETKEVFNDVFSYHKADRYGLVYWSHGDGWSPYPVTQTRWIGQDVSSGDQRMNISLFCEVLDEAPHFDFILMDACFSSSVELIYELRDYTDYYIGSPTETPGPGAPYDKLVPMMAASTNAAQQMASAYFSTYSANYNGGIGISDNNWTGGVSICVVKTSALTQLAAKTKQLWQSDERPATLRSQLFDYDKRGQKHVGYFDMLELAETLTTEASFTEWKQAYDTAIAYWSTTPKNYSQYSGMFSMERANGLSHYVPTAAPASTALDIAHCSTTWYKDAGLSQLGWVVE